MNRDPLTHRLEFAVEVAWRAGRVTLAHYQTGIAAETKPDATPVTAADREAERVARELLEARFPADGILGEEFGAVRPEARHRWVLDPIDGTKSFVQGVPLYAVLLAFERDGEPVLGVIHLPALGETVYAARGAGCWWNGRRARVSDTATLADAVVVTSDAEAIAGTARAAGWDAFRRRVRLVRTWGDAYGYALVATGRADAMLDPTLAQWDAAPLGPIIEEAGGVFTDWDGRRAPSVEHAVATNAALAEPIREVLGGAVGADADPVSGAAGRRDTVADPARERRRSAE